MKSTSSAANGSGETRENPIEPDADPRKRLLMKSASSMARSSGGQGQKRSIPDDESRMQVEETPKTDIAGDIVALAAMSTSVRRRTTKKSEPVAVTTQEAVDGYREKAIRIASVEQIELHNLMELSITGHVIRWARRSNLSGGLTLCKSDGWNLKNHSHLTVARHLREKTHPSVLVVLIREGEDQGLCSAALTELWRIVKDQIEERSVIVVVMSRESAIWQKASLKSVIRENQLKYVGAEEMRVITNNRCVAEQIKLYKEESTAMVGSKVENFGNIERQQNLKDVAMDGSSVLKIGRAGREHNLKDIVMDGGKIGKLENSKIIEEMRCQSEEKLCKSIMKGFAKRSREEPAMLADVKEGKEQNVICFDDITGKELPWHAVRKAREQELKYLHDLGVYEQADEKEAVAKYGITPLDTKWIDTDKAFEGEPMQIR